LQLGGLDEHRYFTSHAIARAHRYALGADLLWVLRTLAGIAALVVLVRRIPPLVRGIGLGRIGAAIVVGMVMLVTLWAVALPFGLATLWWQHHWGLAPFHPISWILQERLLLGSEVGFAMLAIVTVVGIAGRYGRRWWIAATPVFVLLAVAFTFVAGWLETGTKVQRPWLRAEVARLERAEGVRGTPVRVQDVSAVTDQANAFTIGYGPSTNVVLWNTLLDGRFSHRQVGVVVAHELGHVKSRHILKGLGWFALIALPTAILVAEVTRRRGGLERPENLPYALLVLTVVGLLAAPIENVISRRYEAEADWIALQATHDPAAQSGLFRRFQQTSLDEPNPPLLDYLWLENHPTTMQRIAMAERWRERNR
jgi:STE24 endopeptidase